MSDPSLNFIASQKSISDHRAARGLDQGPTRSFNFEAHPASGSGAGGDFIASMVKAVFWLAGAALIVSGVAAFLFTNFVIVPLIIAMISKRR